MRSSSARNLRLTHRLARLPTDCPTKASPPYPRLIACSFCGTRQRAWPTTPSSRPTCTLTASTARFRCRATALSPRSRLLLWSTSRALDLCQGTLARRSKAKSRDEKKTRSGTGPWPGGTLGCALGCVFLRTGALRLFSRKRLTLCRCAPKESGHSVHDSLSLRYGCCCRRHAALPCSSLPLSSQQIPLSLSTQLPLPVPLPTRSPNSSPNCSPSSSKQHRRFPPVPHPHSIASSNPILSHPIPSPPLPSHPIPSPPLPSHPIPSHLAPLKRWCSCCGAGA